MNTFERATKQALLFVTTQGNVSIYDLWELPLTVLDAYAVGLKKRLDTLETDSFIKTVKPKDTTDKLRLDVAVRIIEIRVAELDKAKRAAATKLKNQKIMEAIANKKDSALAEASLEDLEKMLEEEADD